MGLEIIRRRDGEAAPALMADRPLYLTADKARVVEEGDPASAFFLVRAGGPISAADVARYGLRLINGVVALAGSIPPVEPAPVPVVVAPVAAPVAEPAAELAAKPIRKYQRRSRPSAADPD